MLHRGFAALSIMGILLMLTPSDAFSALSTHRLSPRVAVFANNKAMLHEKSSWTSARNKSTLYMSDSASTTANDGKSPVEESSSSKGLLGRLASVIPPAAERQKLIPLGLMFFCILFNYTILRDTKDVLMVSLLRYATDQHAVVERVSTNLTLA